MAQTLGEYLRDRFREAIAGGLADAKSTLDEAASHAGGTNTAPPGGGGSLIGTLVTIIGNIASVFGGVGGAAEGAVSELEKAAGSSGLGFAFGYVLGYVLGPVMQPIIAPLVHDVAASQQTAVFDPDTAAELAAKGFWPFNNAARDAAGGNMPTDHFAALFAAKVARMDVGQLMDLWNLGALGEQDVNNGLQYLGFGSGDFTALKELRRQLLSGADLALANLRGQMDQPTMYGYAAQLGIQTQDMDVLVANTGEPPGAEQLMEAWRRGFIDQATFDHGIRQSRIRNEWIGTMERLRHSPMSISDAARAVVENYLSDADGATIAEQNGLEPDHWPLIVQSWGRPLSHEQMMQLYHRGKASIDEVVQAFRESDLKDKYVEKAVELGRRLIPGRTIVSMLNHGAIAHDQAAGKLMELGYDAQDAQLLITLGTHEHAATNKELTKGDILAALHDSIFTAAQAAEHLRKLGYSAEVANTLVHLEQVRASAALLRQSQTRVRASLFAHHTTAEEAIAELVGDGMDRDLAGELVHRWQSDRAIPRRFLSEAQIKRALDQHVIDPPAAMSKLQALGLTQADAAIYLESYGYSATQLGVVDVNVGG